jgi:hypothetical protein
MRSLETKTFFAATTITREEIIWQWTIYHKWTIYHMLMGIIVFSGVPEVIILIWLLREKLDKLYFLYMCVYTPRQNKAITVFHLFVISDTFIFNKNV